MRHADFQLAGPAGSADCRTAGFTLIELMITIAIAAILATIALPAMRDYILNQRVKTASFDLMTTLSYARSEAIKRSTDIDTSAKSGDWKNGWEVKAGTTVLRDQPPLKGISVTTTSTTVTYGRDGRLAAAAGGMTIDADPGNANVTPRCVSIDLSGRPNSAKGACP